MRVALLLLLSFPLWAQYQPVPSTRYPGLEAILNAKPAAQVAAGVPSGNCTVGKDFYVNSTAHTLYYCSATNTWVQIAGTTASTTINGTTCTLGSTCTVAATPTAHATTHAAGGTDAVTLTEAQITSLTTDLAAKAPLASPTLTGTPAAPTASLGTNTTQIATTAYVRQAANGVFNVRLMYSGVPDGSTNNSTAITNAFTASNAFTSGVPTVYFDCDPGTTACVYNYGGSGTSPINPTVATTIQCAPGATLNYTGTAHAADIGPTGLSQASTDRYSILGCRFTGGASYTAGIYFNDYIVNSFIFGNEFTNFGNQTGYSIVYPGNNWTPVVEGNYWRDSDGVTRNMVDAHTGTNVGLLFTDNKNECETSGGTACSISTTGVGLWLFTGFVRNNEIKYHYPAVRISSCNACGAGLGMWLEGNVFEGNSGGTSPAVTYGDPGTAGAHVGGSMNMISNNQWYWPTASGVPHIGPETASSGSFTLDNLSLIGNMIVSPAPSGGAVYVNTNSGGNAYVLNNRKTGGPLNQSNSPGLLDATAGASAHGGLIATTSAPLKGDNAANAVAAAASDIVGLFTACSGTQYLGADGACHNASITGLATVFNTTNSATAAAIGNVTMVASVSGDTNYLFTAFVAQTGATSGCGTAPTLKVQLTITDAFTGVQTFPVPAFQTGQGSVAGNILTFGSSLNLTNQGAVQYAFRAKSGTAITYSTQYNAGSGCSPGANYSIAPVLVQQ